MEERLRELLNRTKTGTHSKEDLVLISEIARRALKYMVDKSIPIIPENYQLWFYTFGTLILSGQKEPEEDEIERAYKKVVSEFKSPISMDVLNRIQQRTREILNQSAEILTQSTIRIEDFDEKLNLTSSRIEEHAKLEPMIKALLEEISSLRKENQSLTKELRNASKQLYTFNEKIAMHIEQSSLDFLTQVMTRGAFERLLALKLDNLSKTGSPFSLIMIDPDNFKEVNDTYGHVAGDQVLRTLAFTLKLALREEDIIARYGGDEFVAIVPAPLSDAVKIAERLRREIERMRIVWDTTEIRITASFGVAEAKPDDTVTTLIHRADRALYLAKKMGKNGVKTELDLEEPCGS